MNTKIKENWDLTMFYESKSDPQIEKDLVTLEKKVASFNKKYANSKTFYKSAKDLRKALDEYFDIEKLPGATKPILYFYYSRDIGDHSEEVQKNMVQIENRLQIAGNQLAFFPIVLKKLDKKRQKSLLGSKELADFKYFLKLMFDASPHTIDESEEKIVNLKSQPAQNMWINGVEKALNKKTVVHKGKEMSLGEASNLCHDLTTKDRRQLFDKIMQACSDVSDFAESEINAIYTDKKINDELYNYKKSYSQTVQNYENDEKDIEKLVDLVTSNFSISHSFFKLKKKLLGLPELHYADRGAKIGKINKKYDFQTGCQILQSSLQEIDPQYNEIFSRFLENGQIDVFPRKNKTGGAYCSSTYETPTLVLLNYINNFDSVNTMAHEMGHAFHSELSKSLPIQYQSYSLSVAETASTFFENFVFDEVFKTLNDKEKIIALHDKIQGSVSTIFRQIACFNFEKEMHEKVRTQGFVPLSEILNTMNKHMSSYMGPAVTFKDSDGYFFVLWSHLRRPFYVYSYAFGELISSALYGSFKNDHSYIDKINTFLSAGGSMSPKDIFKKAGINISDMQFFETGLKKIEEDIKLLEKLTR